MRSCVGMCLVLVALGLSACAVPAKLIPTWAYLPKSQDSEPIAKADAPPADASTTPPEARPVGDAFRKVAFPIEKSAAQSPDSKRPETVAQFALAFIDRNEPTKAAAFFLEAAEGTEAESKENRFRIACVAAAAALYLQAGELERFKDAANRLRAEFNKYQAAATEPKVSLLLAVADALQGKKAEVSPQLPWAVQELFRDARR